MIRKRSETATLKISIFDFDERETFLIVSHQIRFIRDDDARCVCVCGVERKFRRTENDLEIQRSDTYSIS